MKKLSFLCILVLMLLTACARQQTYSGEGFLIVFSNDTGGEIAAINQNYAIGGEICGGGGMFHADNTPIRPGETLSWEFRPEDFPENISLDQFEIQLSVQGSDGTEYPAGSWLEISAVYGKTYRICLTGSVGEGYAAVVEEEPEC